ncbi:hypothetical protein GCM10023088_34230 [Actinomadura verrucosospora]
MRDAALAHPGDGSPPGDVAAIGHDTPNHALDPMGKAIMFSSDDKLDISPDCGMTSGDHCHSPHRDDAYIPRQVRLFYRPRIGPTKEIDWRFRGIRGYRVLAQ